MTVDATATVDAFIARWQATGGSERANYQLFLNELADLLEVERPQPQGQDSRDHAYVFERRITFRHGDGTQSAGFIDLYRRGAFVCEAKKLKQAVHTRGFDEALLRARSQAEQYARALPAEEGRPPFLIVVDVGQRIELYAEFSRSGGTYTPFPDPRSHRIALTDLRQPTIRERLKQVWLDPLSLDPSRESARVTREIALKLAELARSLEASRHAPERVAQFLMRCLFTMFAEDVKLLPEGSFRDLLLRYAQEPDKAMRMLAQLWRDMDSGGFSAVLAEDVLRFNGKLFKQPDTLPLDRDQIALLIAAAKADWRHVEPAIFGTLLERALSPDERHKLGAHYTPRAYVERLVLPTVIEPLRADWSNAQAAALTLAAENKHNEAVAELLRFHHRLCTVRVLDPACGSGNFLYVTLEHLKRLEGEVLNALDELGYRQTALALDRERADADAGETVDPHNLLGIELNPRAATIAEVVLWIGYLQWHFRTRGDVRPPQPVIRDFRNIENRDAVLAWDAIEYVTDEQGKPVTRWDGRTYKKSPVTGEDIPDETARVMVERYINPRKAVWPEADFVVGNPPFIGASSIRRALGDGYTEAIRRTWPEVPESADFVMYWWHYASALVRAGAALRFGFITTNSIRQAFNRRVIETGLADARNPLFLEFAIPDHPWVDAADGAAVRIAMTVASTRAGPGRLLSTVRELTNAQGEYQPEFGLRSGVIHADLRIGADVASALALRANLGLSSPGLKLHGTGFLVAPEQAARWSLDSQGETTAVVRPYRNGKDLTLRPRGVLLIDLFGRTELEVRTQFPAIYQHVLERVKPERDQNNRETYKKYWWIHGEPRSAFRPALRGLARYIATVETAKHRTFQFLESAVAPDNKLIVIASGLALNLGVLSSALHVVWALASGGNLGVGNDPVYVKTRCFETFAFPVVPESTQSDLMALAESLDAHRKRQQAAHPGLTLTGMYNVLEALREGRELSLKERQIHEQGLVSVLRQIHDELDAAVLEAYGWADLVPLLRVAHGNHPPVEGQSREDAKRAFDEAILERLVALNAERAAEEARGLVRWLRPEFQNPASAGAIVAPEQTQLAVEHGSDGDDPAAPATVTTPSKPQPWPKDPVAQVKAVADVLASSPVPLDTDSVATRFKGSGAWKKRLPQLLAMLVAVGRAREDQGHYRAIG